jgi:acyl-CoA synthetase (AMP-forming)/AMP-acid ligase II
VSTLATLIDEHVKVRPNKVAMNFQGRETTYAGLDRRSNQVANVLMASGLKSGARVAFLAMNTDRYFDILLGVAKARMVLVPINFRLAPPEMAYIVNDADAELFFVDSEFVEFVDGIRDQLVTTRFFVALEGQPENWLHYLPWHADASPGRPAELPGEDDIAIQMYTSGTTGKPKGVLTSHRNIMAILWSEGKHFGHWNHDEIQLLSMPLFHIAGCVWGCFSLQHGAFTILTHTVEPDEILEMIQRDRINRVFLAPSVIQFLLQEPACKSTDFSSLTQVVYGGSPIPPSVLAEALETMKCRFVQAYGLTESTGGITCLPAIDHDPGQPGKLKSCGLVRDNTELKIVDKNQSELPTGEIGEVICRSNQNMHGYWKQPEATAEVLRGEWLHTGDMGYFDADGYLYICDRVKDMIVSGGENVYPAEVEAALKEHPDVEDVAVIGVPDDHWGEAVKAVVILSAASSTSEDDLLGFCRTRIAGYKIPKSIDLVADLPRNETGKILKRKLRAPYWQNEDRQVH